VDRDRIHVAVIGASDADEHTCARAEAAGAAVARHDAVLVSGGLGGVMEAACRGAHTAGGTAIGILPGAERAAANEFVDVAIPTGMGEARNALVVRCADAIVAIGGGYGTLSEIALALRDGKPVVGLDTWELRRDGLPVDAIALAETPDRAVDLAMTLAAAARGEG
jgi:uncharacterized protein (TIGR00725 family)